MVNVNRCKWVKCHRLAEAKECISKWVKCQGLATGNVISSKWVRYQGIAKANGFTIVSGYYRKAICFWYFLSFGFALVNRYRYRYRYWDTVLGYGIGI